MSDVFTLHAQLEADTVPVADLPLSALRLMKCRALPWLVLVPRRAAIREIIELTEQDSLQLWREISQLSRILQREFQADKINVAALGNVVPQLHVHIIARYQSDPAWPKPVWGNLPMQERSLPEENEILARITHSLDTH